MNIFEILDWIFIPVMVLALNSEFSKDPWVKISKKKSSLIWGFVVTYSLIEAFIWLIGE